MIEITLTTGQSVLIWEHHIVGMAGELMTILYCRSKKPKQKLPLRDVMPLMKDNDKKRIKQWWSDLEAANNDAAIAFVM